MDFLLCIISASLAGLAFVFENADFLLFFAPALYFYSLRNDNKPFSKGFLFGLFFYMFNSLFISSLDISHLTSSIFMSKFLPFMAYLSLCAAEGVFSGFFAKIYVTIKKSCNKKFLPLIFSSLWVIYEYLLAFPFSDLAYPFGRISIPLADKPFFIQTASLFGMLFISFLIIYFAASIAMSVIDKSAKYMILPCLLLLVNTVFSIILYHAPENGDNVYVKCVQNGYGGYEKWLTPPRIIIEDSISEFSDADIIVFAESALPLAVNKTSYIHKLSKEAIENDVTVLIGSLYIDKDGKNYTSLYHFPYKEGEIYHKRHPVPFGEYYPILDLFIEELRETSLSKGKSVRLLSDYKLGPVICFDSMFPSYSREAAKEGARLLCVSTNDSWFSKGNAARLHLYHSVYRSVENGRYIARSACTGISAFIDSKGNILDSIPLNKVGTIKGNLILMDEITPYTFWGDAPLLIYSIAAIIISLLFEKRRQKNV